ncbi:MAG: hypothetical protein AB7F89_22515, partial [Pirellulaceae bacterium]
EYLKFAGYNGAFLTVVEDGTALYPSRLLRRIPKFDTGVLAATGQDPVDKDVLELLLRVFDREGLRLVTAVQFSMPLPELDQMRTAGTPEPSPGVQLVGAFANEPRAIPASWTEGQRGAAPFYNPLDARVQTALRRVVAELLDRCAPHDSFAGLSIQLVPHGYAQLPDENWALDDATFARFLRETGLNSQYPAAVPFTERLGLVQGKLREPWLAWRAAGLAEFYKLLQSDVTRASPTARLYLDLHELAGGRPIHTALRPHLPERDDFQDALLRHGLDASLLSRLPATVVLRPHRVAPQLSLPNQGVNLELEQSTRIERYFQRSGMTGAVVFHEPQPLRVPGFDQASPLGADHTSTWLLSHIRAAGPSSRAQLVNSVVALDCSTLVTGGWMVPLGEEESLRPLLHACSQLPDRRFVDVPRTRGEGAERKVEEAVSDSLSRIAVRSLVLDGRTYIYAANATSIPAQVLLELPPRASDASVDVLAGRAAAVTLASEGTGRKVALEPYDLVALVVSKPEMSPASWRVEFAADDIEFMRRQVQDLRSRVEELGRPQPLLVLDNPGFETEPAEGQIRGWSATAGVAVKLDSQSARHGKSSLNLRLDGTQPYGRVRSNFFAIPHSGRLSFLVRLRAKSAEEQPAVRLAIEGQLSDGTPIYRFSETLGSAIDGRTLRPTGGTARALPTQWTQGREGEFLFHFAHLPTHLPGEISVGLDLFSAGDVWLDDVELFDMYFQEDERHELAKKPQTALLQWTRKNYGECRHLLDGYWPRFVMQFGQSARLTQLPDKSPTPSAVSPAPAPAADKPGWWQRLSPRQLFTR